MCGFGEIAESTWIVYVRTKHKFLNTHPIKRKGKLRHIIVAVRSSHTVTALCGLLPGFMHRCVSIICCSYYFVRATYTQ